jgi:hypothetical protein
MLYSAGGVTADGLAGNGEPVSSRMDCYAHRGGKCMLFHATG